MWLPSSPKTTPKPKTGFVVSKLITKSRKPSLQAPTRQQRRVREKQRTRRSTTSSKVSSTPKLRATPPFPPLQRRCRARYTVDARRANIPDLTVVYVACKLAQLTVKRIGELLDYMRARAKALPEIVRLTAHLRLPRHDSRANEASRRYLPRSRSRNTGEAPATRFPCRSARKPTE